MIKWLRESLRRLSPRVEPRYIVDPSFGQCVRLDDSNDIVEAGRSMLASLFRPSSCRSPAGLPICDVLFLYVHIDDGGRLEQGRFDADRLARETGASLVVIANENDADNSTRTGELMPGVDLVVTLERDGQAFPRFFGSLFRLMFEGRRLPQAWVELSPQGPAWVHGDEPLPGTLLLCRDGRTSFRHRE